MKSCFQCRHYRDNFLGRCHREMRMQSGQVLAQHNSGRSTETERDEKAKCWKTMKRDMGDVCGKTGKFWAEK